ncbi:MAG: 16S rRNA (guanine(527)-N(7))-methyltransferase RsmG [Cytophagales bacterium]|nr:MAG: 16S rRNA (guanine(527)-N(7))-methyltransferase RsmG [Cytophagales bacterium]TAF60084.1 MAG: 16S rRNA (guanine(527)-N(7))-methyltransferase RsmG [Cytophagales bacterium]
MTPQDIFDYFPELTPTQRTQIEQLMPLYADWNDKINLISRKDFSNFYERHVLHSLGIAKVINFVSGTSVLDAGTGGGFPGIPLAVMFPETQFLLADSIGKKVKVAEDVAAKLGLKNVRTMHIRAEAIPEQFDFAMGRAVTEIPQFWRWIGHLIHKDHKNTLKNGLIYLKGGDMGQELAQFKRHLRFYDLNEYFKTEFFETKKVVYVPV